MLASYYRVIANRQRIHMMTYLSYESGLIYVCDTDTEQEKSFRERYAEELRKKRQNDTYSYRENDELYEERVKVNQQEKRQDVEEKK